MHAVRSATASVMSQPVFISYARDASRDKAEALHHALGGRTAFLDTADIAPGERFPEALVDALFDARVVVIFAEPQYFTRWYCLLEFRIARTPFLRAVERPGATVQEKEDALRGLVVAMPPRGVDPMMDRFPPLVRARNWPAVDDIDAIAALVEAELAANPSTLRERYASVADADTARSFLLEATRLPPPMRIGSLPFVPQVGLAPTIGDAFVGRADDLWRIHDLLWTERGDPATAAGLTGSIEAIGGFGKTRLALEYLYRFGPRHFRGGLFWINAESDPELQLYDVLLALNPSAPAIEAVRQIPGGVPSAVARAIRAQSEDPPLFIIDNIPEPQPGEPPKPLNTWCPVLGDVPVLTTSRTRVALGAGGSVVALPINTLDPTSAVELLTTEIPRDQLDEAEWKHIAEWVGHLPLALEVLNRVLRSGEMPPAALRELSREQRPSAAVDAAMESIRHVVPEGALRGITEAFSASYNLLSPEEQYAARLIAWMAPAPIPTFIIDAFGPDVFAPGIRAKLRTRSLVTEVRERSVAYFGTMHRLLADFVRAQSNAPDTEVETVSLLILTLTDSADGRGAEGSVLVRECGPLAISLFGNWLAGPITEDGFHKAWSFANQAGMALWLWRHAALARDLFAAVASASRQWLGSEHPDTLTPINNLAEIHRSRGDLAGAEELHAYVLETRLRVLGEEHPHTLTTLGNMASLRAIRGDHAGAEELEQRVVDTMRRVLGEEDPATLVALSNLALTRQARGDYAGVQELQERVLEVRLRVLGEEHRATLTALNNLAFTKHAQRDYAGAQELQERVLETRNRVLGEEHPDTLMALSNLAEIRRSQGDHAGAEKLHERAAETMRRVLGEDHPETLDVLHNLGSTRHALGDLAGAQKLEEGVMEARTRILGVEHPDTLATMANLALTRRALKDYAGAQELLEHVLKALERVRGDKHPDTLAVMRSLSATKRDLGDIAGATELQQRLLAATRKPLDPERP
jgi:hypothetical protein